MTWLITGLCVIVVPGVVSLFLVRRHGPFWGVAILAGLAVWLCVTIFAGRNPGSTPIAPEIFGGQTIGYSQRLGLREMAWALFVLAPATLWAGIALLIGRASYTRAKREAEPS